MPTKTTAGRPLSKVKKTMAPHMWVISRDPAGGYLITVGDPNKSSSKIKESWHGSDAKDELMYWARYDLGKKVSEDHVIDQTGLKIVPPYHTQRYVENTIAASVSATLDNVAEELERRRKPQLAMQVDDVSQDFSTAAKLQKNKPVEIDDITSIPEGHSFSWRTVIWDVVKKGVARKMDGSKQMTLKEIQEVARQNESKMWAKPTYYGKTPRSGW